MNLADTSDKLHFFKNLSTEWVYVSGMSIEKKVLGLETHLGSRKTNSHMCVWDCLLDHDQATTQNQ